jgi:excisionase family DNA binding protein
LSTLLKSEILKDRPLVVGVGKAAVLLDCSRDRIYRFIKSGELESYVEGTRRKITMASIEALIAKRLAANGREFQRCHQRPQPPTEETRRKIAATKKRKAALREEAAAQ